MPFLLDTCAICEPVSKKPNPHAMGQLVQLPRDEIHISAITIGEVEQGIQEMQPCKRRTFLESWLEDHVLALYADRTYAVDVAIGREWGRLVADLRKRGFKMQVKDSLLAATALLHGLVVVTRNEADFVHSGVRILNPWK